MDLSALLVLAGAVAAAAKGAGWLSASGAWAAAAVGTFVLAGAGWAGGALLALFFVSGSILTFSRVRVGQSGGRSATQVWANGLGAAIGAATLLAQLRWGWPVLIGSLAAAQADTWATEIGRSSATWPRLMTNWTPVPTGTSGAVSIRGSTAGVAGAAVMGIGGALVGLELILTVAATIGGVAGMLVDSLMGATIQAQFVCERCAVSTEMRIHSCGNVTSLTRGLAWLDNDGVNLIGSLAGGAVAFVAYSMLR